jgi:4a-hydroxytetrahydrobiopterin dehydratase
MERGPADRFDRQQIEAELANLSDWSLEGDQVVKTFARKNFVEAANFIQRIATVAESLDHHPDVLLHGYKNVKVMTTTHSAGGITQNDFDLAHAIDELD